MGSTETSESRDVSTASKKREAAVVMVAVIAGCYRLCFIIRCIVMSCLETSVASLGIYHFFHTFWGLFCSQQVLRSTFLLTSGVDLCRFNTLKGTWTFSQGFSPIFDPFQAPTRIFTHFPPQGSRIIDLRGKCGKSMIIVTKSRGNPRRALAEPREPWRTLENG